jgi:HPt (histidine-containing phosphotransfer) domain-containing protein
VETVYAQLGDGYPKAAERSTHSVKGVAGTLGAGELQQLAGGLEAAIKEGRPETEIEKHLKQVGQKLTRIITAIRRALPDKGFSIAAKAADVDWGRVKEAVKGLEELLESNDGSAMAVFEESASLLRAAFGSAAVALEEAIAGWDFPAALEALQAAKADRDEFK